MWVEVDDDNAAKLVTVTQEFGFLLPEVTKRLFLQPEKIIRMGMPPVRIEILTSISGVEFLDCYVDRIEDTMDGVPVNIISLDNLKKNKLASGRHKDLDDLEHLA